jgi:hypothetical protein
VIISSKCGELMIPMAPVAGVSMDKDQRLATTRNLVIELPLCHFSETASKFTDFLCGR